MVNFGNVNVTPPFATWPMSLWHAATGRRYPGYDEAQYELKTVNGSLQFVRKLPSSLQAPLGAEIPIGFALNKYEMFAFGASSIVAALGGVNDMNGLGGVFSAGVNLRIDFGPNTVFNNLNTGHSAQFVHSFLEAKHYWIQLTEDIQ